MWLLRSLAPSEAEFTESIVPVLRETPLLESLVVNDVEFVRPNRLEELIEILARTELINNPSQDSNLIFLSRIERLSFIGTKFYLWHLVPFLFPPIQRHTSARYRPLDR